MDSDRLGEELSVALVGLPECVFKSARNEPQT